MERDGLKSGNILWWLGSKKNVIFSLKLYSSSLIQALSNKQDNLVVAPLWGNRRRTQFFLSWKHSEENFRLIISQQVISTLMSFQPPCSTTTFITPLTFPVTSLGLLMQALAPWGSLMRNSHSLHYSRRAIALY